MDDARAAPRSLLLPWIVALPVLALYLATLQGGLWGDAPYYVHAVAEGRLLYQHALYLPVGFALHHVAALVMPGIGVDLSLKALSACSTYGAVALLLGAAPLQRTLLPAVLFALAPGVWFHATNATPPAFGLLGVAIALRLLLRPTTARTFAALALPPLCHLTGVCADAALVLAAGVRRLLSLRLLWLLALLALVATPWVGLRALRFVRSELELLAHADWVARAGDWAREFGWCSGVLVPVVLGLLPWLGAATARGALWWTLLFAAQGLIVNNPLVGAYYLGPWLALCVLVARAPTWPRWAPAMLGLAALAQPVWSLTVRKDLVALPRATEGYLRAVRAVAGEAPVLYFADEPYVWLYCRYYFGDARALNLLEVSSGRRSLDSSLAEPRVVAPIDLWLPRPATAPLLQQLEAAFTWRDVPTAAGLPPCREGRRRPRRRAVHHPTVARKTTGPPR